MKDEGGRMIPLVPTLRVGTQRGRDRRFIWQPGPRPGFFPLVPTLRVGT